MEKIAQAVQPLGRESSAPDSMPAKVQESLGEIFKSTPFRSSKQSQQLLQYIIDQSLAGHVERLKERIIGAEVFGRPFDYDTNADPIVRARAAEVRKRLAQYYLGEGHVSTIRIEISPGSYLASFSVSEVPLEPTSPDSVSPLSGSAFESNATPTSETVPPAAKRRGSRVARRLGFLAFSSIILFGIAALAYLFLKSPDPVAEFWAPILGSSRPILIYTGTNAVYMPTSQLIDRFKATHHVSDLDSEGHEFLIPISGDMKIGVGDLLEDRNEFVTVGDVAANVSMASLLTRFKHPFDLRSGEDVAFGDLRESPTILIGGFNNQWTLQMTGGLPFVLGSGLTIRDRSNERHWQPVISSENKVEVDYALVARLPHSNTGSALIAIAGIMQSGTRAAAEFISTPQGLTEMIKAAPANWKTKNLEFVLQTKVVNDIPTTPMIVALRTW